MQKHLQQMQEIKSSWDASPFQISTDATPQQNGGSGGNSNHSQPQQNQNSSPQNSGQYLNQNQNCNSGSRGGGRGRGYGPGRRQATTLPGKPEGWNRLCFWCRDFVTFDDANHPIKECPYYREVKKEWRQHQQQISPPQPANPTSQNPNPEGKPVRNPSEDGNGIPSKQPSTFGRNTGMNDDEWYHELRARYKMAMSIKAHKEIDNYTRKQFANPESKFYNPDAWSRLIGKSNVVITYIDGQEVKTLLDTGAKISFMSEEYAKKRGFKIQPLEKLVNFTGANGLAIEYSGYVEVNLQLPNKGFNQDILILVVPHIEYHNFVPITLGTPTLEAIDEHLITNNLVQNLETEWRLVHQAILYRQSLTKDHILGLVRATKNIIIQPFSCVNISGLVRTQKGGFSLHVVAEPSIQAKLPEGIALAGEQYLDITQGSSRVGLLFENQTEKSITIKERTICVN